MVKISISKDLEDYIVNQFKKIYKKYPLEQKDLVYDENKPRFVQFPVMIDFVYDFVVYDRLLKTFTIRAMVGNKGSAKAIIGEASAYFDQEDIRIIEIPVNDLGL